MNLFIAHQYENDVHEQFAVAATLECMRLLTKDFFSLTEKEFKEFNEDMRAYLMR
jgi:hypothetical protein